MTITMVLELWSVALVMVLVDTAQVAMVLASLSFLLVAMSLLRQIGPWIIGVQF